MQNRILAPLLLPAVCLIIGITIGRYFSFSSSLILSVLISTLVGAVLLKRWEYLQSLCLCLACGMVGCLLCLHQQTKLRMEWPTEEHCWQMVVTSEPVVHGKTVWMDALLATTGQKIQLRLMRDERSQQLTVGDGLVIRSTIKPLSAQGSYRTYQETHGYVGEVFVWRNRWQRDSISLENLSIIDRTRLFFLHKRHLLLQQVKGTITTHQDDYAILAAMTLGDKSAISREQKESYAIAGTSHLLALSGLHLGIIYMLLSWLFRNCRRQLLSQVLLVASVWAFVLLVGMPSSVVRAAVMISIYALVTLLNRSKAPVNTLALAAIVMLCFNPYSLFDAGFQLSFAAVLAILLFVPLFESLFTTQRPPLTFLKSMTAVSIAAQIGTAPLVAYHFGRFSPWFLLSNYVSIPLVTIILYAMLLLLLLGFWPMLQTTFSIVPATLASWLNGWTSWVASLPLASIDGLRPTLFQVFLLYLIIGCCYWLLCYFERHGGGRKKRRNNFVLL